ncbi:ABC1-domain-containing protein [Amylocystis lapponica]|nr:ABC1-domain-containing protein [Amylocystis lapponica]
MQAYELLERAGFLAPPAARKLQSSKVPSSRVGRLFHYGGLAASLGYGAASELLRRSTSDDSASRQHQTLVSKLTQLRGAALKLGQFMSIQGSCFPRPASARTDDVMRVALGPSWEEHFDSFDRLPFAAASIGQVHAAVLRASSSPTGSPARVAVKIQFPNIAGSIASDLGYVKMLLTAGRLLPRGLFLDNTIQVMKEELADECDYTREASGGDPRFKVPWVWEGSTERVLVMEYVEGVSVGGAAISALSQRERNDIAARIIALCLKELFVLRAMQTDPNWTNFLWNARTQQIALVDFGATRAYSKTFIDSWLRVLQAALSGDREACIAESLALGYLTGAENEVMLDAHVRSMTLLATPFKADTPQPFTFGPHSQWAAITAEIRALIPVMLQHRLTPPPRETYSLNRKLSGSFLLAARLNASVDCKVLWDQVVKGYQFGPVSDEEV